LRWQLRSGEVASRDEGLPRCNQGRVRECLISDITAEGRDFLMHARISMLRALNRHVERVFDPTCKDPNWGKRKLKRDL
jgi:hypothetical protein